MRTIKIEMPTPIFDDRACLLAAAEPFGAQVFVAELAVEALVGSILPGLSGINEGRCDSRVLQPAQDGAGDELRCIVRTRQIRN